MQRWQRWQRWPSLMWLTGTQLFCQSPRRRGLCWAATRSRCQAESRSPPPGPSPPTAPSRAPSPPAWMPPGWPFGPPAPPGRGRGRPRSRSVPTPSPPCQGASARTRPPCARGGPGGSPGSPSPLPLADGRTRAPLRLCCQRFRAGHQEGRVAAKSHGAAYLGRAPGLSSHAPQRPVPRWPTASTPCGRPGSATAQTGLPPAGQRSAALGPSAAACSAGPAHARARAPQPWALAATPAGSPHSCAAARQGPRRWP
mmetsp:Transcript_62603/g.183575  ORF Transcript_62603/g.183575 Transcript_62603/m.183575 type:complete len:255 (-) Transcript_62603:57-821(-)